MRAGPVSAFVERYSEPRRCHSPRATELRRELERADAVCAGKPGICLRTQLPMTSERTISSGRAPSLAKRKRTSPQTKFWERVYGAAFEVTCWPSCTASALTRVEIEQRAIRPVYISRAAHWCEWLSGGGPKEWQRTATNRPPRETYRRIREALDRRDAVAFGEARMFVMRSDGVYHRIPFLLSENLRKTLGKLLGEQADLWIKNTPIGELQIRWSPLICLICNEWLPIDWNADGACVFYQSIECDCAARVCVSCAENPRKNKTPDRPFLCVRCFDVDLPCMGPRRLERREFFFAQHENWAEKLFT